MNISSKKPWSATMKAALLVLSAIGVIVCAVVVITVVKERRLEAVDIARMIGGGAWAAFTFSLRRHPEWKRFLGEALY